jgi:ceramide glucosyltransferase
MRWPAVLCSIYWFLAIVAALRHPRRKPAPLTATPVSILKPIRGRDEGFYNAIASHATQDHPNFEILFGVRDPSDPALPDIHRLIAAYPEVSIRIITEAPITPNGKVGILISLAQAARHPILLVNDSDILVEPDYLRRATAPLADPSIGLVTCLYRARGASFPARFEALGISTFFIPSILVARLIGVAGFALGSTMALRTDTLREINGFESIADYLADDYQLGARISATGRRVVLAGIPVETNLGAGTWTDVWKHQVRWARTVRVSRTAGFVGSIITHASLWSLVALASGAWLVALTCIVLRLAAAALSARVVEDRGIPWHLLPLRGLFRTFVWAAALFGDQVVWRGETLTLRRDGRIS